MNILVVDDDAVVSSMLTVMLETEGHVVQVARGGEEALNCVSELGFDLVLTDLRMTEMDGITLIDALQERRPSLPCILLTGYMTDNVRENAENAGASAVVAKPFSREEILDVIERVVPL